MRNRNLPLKAEGPRATQTMITSERRLHSWYLPWVPWVAINRKLEIEFFPFAFEKNKSIKS